MIRVIESTLVEAVTINREIVANHLAYTHLYMFIVADKIMSTVDYDWNTDVTDMTEGIDDMVEQYENEIKDQKESSYWNPTNFATRRAELDEMGM